jgi:hypothetical protein
MLRAGDPGGALQISLRGEISLRLPGTTRRLASFALGARVRHQPRQVIDLYRGSPFGCHYSRDI